MTEFLPENPSLENLKKRAKSFLTQCQTADAAALERVRQSHPQYVAATEAQLRAAIFSLADCQLILAREHGHATWADLKAAIESGQANSITIAEVTPELAHEFLVAALLTYADDYKTDITRANAMLREQPRLSEANIWCAAAVGNADAVASFLDDDPTLVERKGGPYQTTPLLCLCYSRATSDNKSHDAITTANVLLDRGADPNSHFFTHGTYRFTCVTGAIGEGENGPVMFSPHAQALRLATLLLERGANPNDSQGLYNSMFTGGTHWIQLLLDHGLNAKHVINWSERDGQPTLDFLLAHACKKNMIDRVKLLLENGADPNSRDSYEKCPCYEVALQNGNTQIVELLVNYGAKRLDPTSDKQRFYNACMAADARVVETIRAANGDRKVQSWIKASRKHLSLATDTNKLQAVQFMLDLGFPIGDALFDAAWHGRLEIARLLVERGASARQRHHQHHVTPVAFADRVGHLDVVEYLMEQDIDVFDAIRFDRPDRLATILADDPEALERPMGKYARRSDRKKQTPLVFAVLWGKAEAVQMLLEKGADRSQRHDRKALVEVARSHGFEDVAALLT